MRGPNMSYCKWENTAAAMEQCLAEGEDDFYGIDSLSEYERGGFARCLQAAYTMLESVPAGILAEMGIRVENLR